MAQTIRLRHPDHEQRDDTGIYETDDPVEAMNLQTRGYELVTDDATTSAEADTAATDPDGSQADPTGGDAVEKAGDPAASAPAPGSRLGTRTGARSSTSSTSDSGSSTT